MAPSRLTLTTNSLLSERLAPDTIRHPKITVATLAVFTLGFFLDVVTTRALLTTPGFTELNPIMDFMGTHAGMLGIAGYKTILATSAIGVVTWTELLRVEAAANVCFLCVGTMWLLAGIHNALFLV